MKILVIEDEPEILKIYHKLLISFSQISQNLTKKGEPPHATVEDQTQFEVTSANQGELGVQEVEVAKAMGDPFALAFIDMRMPPGIDGLETAERILAIDPNIEIVIVTAFSDRPRRDLVRALGKSRFLFLKKPFHPDELIQMAQLLTFRWQIQRERGLLDREKEMFASNMSHELNHPVHVILGVCSTLLNCEMSREQQMQFIQDIETETRRLGQMAQQLRTLADLGKTPQGSVEKQPLDLIPLVDRIVRLLRSDAEKKQLSLTREGDAPLPNVLGSEDQLGQVFLNLVSNAINYTNSGSIQIILKQQDNHVAVSVRDTGVGISQADQQLIFRKFYRVKSQALKVRGHGLGLSIVKSLVEEHQSQLTLTSKLGKGSCFSFQLPVTF